MTDLGLHNLHPAAGSHRTRKRVGRGTASGTGKTSGRGQKGQKSRSGSHYMRPGFEGGQMPLYMRLGKLRGPHMKKSMPMGPFRTSNEIVNLEQLAERFEAGAEVTPATLVAVGLLKHTREPVKVLGRGELSVALTVSAHAFSASARQKIEAAGGTVTVLDRGPKPADAETAAPAAEPPPRPSRSPAPRRPRSRPPTRRRSPRSPRRTSPPRSRRRPRTPATARRPTRPARRTRRTTPRRSDAVLTAIVHAFKVPELRRRLAFTALILLLYRAGSWLPTPGVDTNEVQGFFDSGAGSTILGYLNLFSGQALQNLSLFALGIMPYITASIIIQLLQVVIPALEKLRKEGEAGQKRITQYTRYLTVALAALQSAGYVFLFHNGSVIGGSNILPDLTVRSFLLIVLTLTAGTTLLMWMGELITQRGVGNGMSLLIFASILTSVPIAVQAWVNSSTFQRLSLPIVILGVILAVVFINEGQRRIPIQYAKRMVGRRMTSGGSTYMPLRVNMAGVIPVIFAVAVLFFPPTHRAADPVAGRGSRRSSRRRRGRRSSSSSR